MKRTPRERRYRLWRKRYRAIMNRIERVEYEIQSEARRASIRISNLRDERSELLEDLEAVWEAGHAI